MNTIAKRRHLILFLLITGCYSVSAQPLQFTKLQEKDGLANGFVTTIFQDSRDFLWLGTAGGLHRYDGYAFKVFLHDETDSLSLSNNQVWNIAEDDAGHIWAGTDNGLNRLDPGRETITRIKVAPGHPDSLSNSAIIGLLADTSGTVWVATANGLNRYLPRVRRFKRYLHESKPADDRPFRPSRTPVQTRNGTIWVGVQDTLYRYEEATDSFSGIRLPGNDEAANFIRLIYEDLEGFLWIATQGNGAFQFDPRTMTFFEHYYHEPANPNSLSNNLVSAFIQNGDELWIGTTGGGLNVLNLKTGRIDRYTGSPPDPFGVNSETIRDAWEDNRGNIWLGSYYDGLYQFKSSQRIFSNFDQNTGLLSKKVNDIEETSDGKIWITMGTGGLAVFDPESERFIRYYQNEPGNADGLPPGDLSRLHKDGTGRLWVASASGGISRLDTASGLFSRQLPKKPGDLPFLDMLNDFLVEDNGDIWIARQTGLVKYIRESQSFRTYLLPDKEDATIDYGQNNFVKSVFRDRRGQLWFTTYGGLNLYHPETDSFTFFPFQYQALGLLEDSSGKLWVSAAEGPFLFDQATQTYSKIPFIEPAISLLEDRQQQIWFYTSTTAHVIRYDPATNKTTLLDRQDGLADGFFWTGHISRTGTLFLGGTGGLTVFHPDSLPGSPPPPRVVLTDFRLFNRTVPLQGSRDDTLSWRSPLARSITFTESVTLRHWQNYFSLEFAALDFTAPAANRYQYQLEGYDEDWVQTNAGHRFVTYTNLSPGTYTFRVKGATRNGPWSTEAATVQIRILPPWWKTIWAYLAYALAAFLIIRTIYVFQLNRRLAQAEAERWKELDAAKSRLFTNVTHEFRTPLTVILGMAQQVKEDPREWFSEGMDAIIRNGKQVLRLVNQMLDLSRLETGHLPIRYQQGDIIPYISYLVQSFQSYAASRQIDLQFSKETDSLQMDFDPDLLDKVVNNLLSNAVKFTPEKGNVKVSVKSPEDKLEILFEDDGIGIPEEQLPHIFDRFYQADNSSIREGEGTGIGLALVKEIVDKMGGDIQVSSEPGVGTLFKLTLPVRREAPLMETPVYPGTLITETPAPAFLPDEQSDGEGPTVLIIEDNADVARYTAGCLQDRYAVQLATNGRIGLEKALEQIPDLIICDVMMPEMDGYEVCDRLKRDERTSHIPIVMLTAKADTDSRLEGLRRGADAYLTKPFNRQELEIRLENLIALRKKIQQRFASFPELSQTEDADLRQEDAFLQKLKAAVLSRISDEDFGIPELCRELTVSRAQLHRKLKALTGRSASHVVRSIRLQRAMELVRSSDWNISEIAYQTGFKNPSHFTAVFAEEFGQTPTEMREARRMKQ